MEMLPLLGVALAGLASTVVGARLLLISRRTRGFPEFVLGFSLAAITGIGFPIALFASPAVGFLWSAVEAFLYHATLRRRLALWACRTRSSPTGCFSGGWWVSRRVASWRFTSCCACWT